MHNYHHHDHHHHHHHHHHQDIIHLDQQGIDDHKSELCERCGELGHCCVGGASSLGAAENDVAGLAGAPAAPEEIAVDSGQGIPLPAAIADYGSWENALRRSALTNAERDARSVAIQELRNVCEDTLKDTPNPCHSVKEAGSFAKGTDWLHSDVDVVVFVKNRFSADANRDALAAIQAALFEMPGWVIGHLNKHSLSCRNEPIDCKFDVLIGGLEKEQPPNSPRFFLGLKPELHRLWMASACTLQKTFMLDVLLHKQELVQQDPGSQEYRKVKSSFQGAVRLLKLWADESGLNSQGENGGRNWKMRSYLFEVLLARVLLPMDAAELAGCSPPKMFRLCLLAVTDPADDPLRVALVPFAGVTIEDLRARVQSAIDRWNLRKGSGAKRRERGQAEVALDPANPTANVADDFGNPYDIPFSQLRKHAADTINQMQL
jgi:hypothetical protein